MSGAYRETHPQVPGTICPIYPGGIVLYGVNQQAFLYYARVCPSGPITSLLSYKQLTCGCQPGGNCASAPNLSTALGYLNNPNKTIDGVDTSTRNVAFDAATVDITTAIQGTVKPDSTVQNDPLSNRMGIVVSPPRTLQIANLLTAGAGGATAPLLIRVFRLDVTPPLSAAIVDSHARPTPPHVITFGCEVEPGATNVQQVAFPAKVFTPFFCQVLDPALGELFHVRTQRPISTFGLEPAEISGGW
jgi:hypothetical protein